MPLILIQDHCQNSDMVTWLEWFPLSLNLTTVITVTW